MSKIHDTRTARIQARFALQRRRVFWLHVAVAVLILGTLLAGGTHALESIPAIIVFGVLVVGGAVFYGINCACPACTASVGNPLFVRFCFACGARLR